MRFRHPGRHQPGDEGAPAASSEWARSVDWRAAIQAALGDSCEVRRLLGRGGFAEVYVAFDERLKREIPVKTIRGDLVVNEMLLERFQREAEAVAKLRHSNVVPIFSVGESNGLAYFTMPLIEGESLAAALEREGRLPILESVRVLRQASHALHAAHRAGIVHRDVKPENIMLEGPERSVVVMDFGIAKSGGVEKGLTATGMLIGTPNDMSPEQAMGERALDARSDQYALAIVGYQMVTGRGPFEAASMQALIFKTVTEVPLAASLISPDVPHGLSDVLAKAMSKRPEDRFESMAAFDASLIPFEHAVTENIKTACGRARMDMATRTKAMRAAIPPARRWMLGTVLAGAAAVACFVAATPRVPLIMAASRDDAVFAAKTFLQARGVPAGREEFVEFTSQDSVFRFLQKQLSAVAMEQRAMADAPVWEWLVMSVSSTANDHWNVWVGPNGRIAGLRQVIPDSAAGVRLSADSARALAEHEVAVQCWPLSRLERVSDSTITRKARTDYVFRWKQRGGAVAWRGDDSGYVRLRVTITGDRVVALVRDLKIPDGYATKATPVWLSGVLILGAVLATMFAVVTTVQRQQTAELEWRSLILLYGAIAVGLLIIMLPAMYTSLKTTSVSDPYQAVILIAITTILLGGVGVCVAVAGDVMAYSEKPDIVAGIHDVARGRLLIPELVPASARGYLFGALVTLASGLGLFIANRLAIGTPYLPRFSFNKLPLLASLLSPPLFAIGMVLLLLYALAASLQLRQLSRTALVLPAVICAITRAPWGNGGAAILSIFVCVGLLTYALWRYGALTAMVAVVISESLERAVILVRAGDAHYLLGAAGSLAMMAAPAVLAVLALRRFSGAGDSRVKVAGTRAT